MSQDIHTHLEKLKAELEKLEPAVKHLQKADENATVLIASLTNIHKEFTKHLQNIEKSLADANEKHQKQLTKEIQEATKKVNDASEQLTKSNASFELQIKTLISKYASLGDATAELVRTIDTIDFPRRLEKLSDDAQLIYRSVQATQTNLANLERKLTGEILSKTKELFSKLDFIKNSLDQKLESIDELLKTQFEKQSKENKLLKILLFVSIGMSVIIIAIQFIN
jgi:predicted  nucleic acid-binding Zn-ribbon protein